MQHYYYHFDDDDNYDYHCHSREYDYDYGYDDDEEEEDHVDDDDDGNDYDYGYDDSEEGVFSCPPNHNHQDCLNHHHGHAHDGYLNVDHDDESWVFSEKNTLVKWGSCQ